MHLSTLAKFLIMQLSPLLRIVAHNASDANFNIFIFMLAHTRTFIYRKKGISLFALGLCVTNIRKKVSIYYVKMRRQPEKVPMLQ